MALCILARELDGSYGSIRSIPPIRAMSPIIPKGRHRADRRNRSKMTNASSRAHHLLRCAARSSFGRIAPASSAPGRIGMIE